MPSSSRIIAHIIDNKPDRVLRLREVLNTFELASNFWFRGTAEASRDIDLNNKAANLIVVGPDLEYTEATTFIKAQVEDELGKKAACVIVRGQRSDSASDVSQLIQDGFDSILQEPFSITQITEVFQIAEQIRGKRANILFRMEMQLVLVDLITFMTAITTSKNKNISSRVSSEALDQIKERLTKLHDRNSILYYEIIVSTFIKIAEALDDISQKQEYSGASKRVRQKIYGNAVQRAIKAATKYEA